MQEVRPNDDCVGIKTVPALARNGKLTGPIRAKGSDSLSNQAVLEQRRNRTFRIFSKYGCMSGDEEEIEFFEKDNSNHKLA